MDSHWAKISSPEADLAAIISAMGLQVAIVQYEVHIWQSHTDSNHHVLDTAA